MIAIDWDPPTDPEGDRESALDRERRRRGLRPGDCPECGVRLGPEDEDDICEECRRLADETPEEEDAHG